MTASAISATPRSLDMIGQRIFTHADATPTFQQAIGMSKLANRPLVDVSLALDRVRQFKSSTRDFALRSLRITLGSANIRDCVKNNRTVGIAWLKKA